MQKVALNGRFTGTPRPTGTQTASFQLFDAIIRESQDMEFVVFADPRFPGVKNWGEIDHVNLKPTPFQSWSRERAHVWEQFQAPFLAARNACKLMHHPMTTSPFWQQGVSHLVTLHDLNFLLHPEWYSRSFRIVYAICATPGLKRSRCVVTISDYVRRQTSEYLRIPPQRLRMIHNGSKMLYADKPMQGNYLLTVGSLQPHKNLSRLIQAFLLIRHSFPGLELWIAGRPQPRFSSDKALEDLLKSPGIRMLGYLPDDELANAYAGAQVFCYPSLEEGFGLPILEAMRLGCPVLTSQTSCFPEVAGPALQIDPYSIPSISEGLKYLLNLSPSKRDSVKQAGQSWAAGFSWKESAKKYLSLYQELLA